MLVCVHQFLTVQETGSRKPSNDETANIPHSISNHSYFLLNGILMVMLFYTEHCSNVYFTSIYFPHLLHYSHPKSSETYTFFLITCTLLSNTIALKVQLLMSACDYSFRWHFEYHLLITNQPLYSFKSTFQRSKLLIHYEGKLKHIQWFSKCSFF